MKVFRILEGDNYGIETHSISDQIFKILKTEILHQKFELGEKIETRKLSDKYEVSVMPVRDALKKLAKCGLVEKKERVGFFVRSFEPYEIKEIVDVRKMYEAYCLQKYINNLNKNELENIYNDMLNYQNPPRNEFDRQDKKFHEFIINSSQNEFLIKEYSKIEDLIDLVRHLDRDRKKEALQEHKKIIESILEEDIQTAVSLLKNHINNVRDSIIKEYSKTLD